MDVSAKRADNNFLHICPYLFICEMVVGKAVWLVIVLYV